eukprot:1931015-Prymnesium_polylepis.1
MLFLFVVTTLGSEWLASIGADRASRFSCTSAFMVKKRLKRASKAVTRFKRRATKLWRAAGMQFKLKSL